MGLEAFPKWEGRVKLRVASGEELFPGLGAEHDDARTHVTSKFLS
jgi:hypothetical protein